MLTMKNHAFAEKLREKLEDAKVETWKEQKNKQRDGKENKVNSAPTPPSDDDASLQSSFKNSPIKTSTSAKQSTPMFKSAAPTDGFLLQNEIAVKRALQTKLDDTSDGTEDFENIFGLSR